jgi:single-strand DNA-binding protein
MNRLQVIGNLTADAEVKEANGKKAINFSLATNEKYKDANGTIVEKTYYYGCTIWRDSNVNISEYLTKGTKVYVEGKPESEAYKDKNGDIKGAIKINVSNIELIGGGSKKETQTTISDNKIKKADDDLPF